MTTDAGTRGRWYLHRLTAADRELVAAVATSVDLPGPDDPTGPARLEDLFATPELFAAVFPEPEHDPAGLATVSPFLVFAVAIHRAHRDLDPASVVAEWTGPRERLPVFAGAELRTFLDGGDHRLFLAELLASYTRVSSGAVTVRRDGRLHRQRFSELDPAGMARLLDVVADEARPGLYRRLGDCSLYLTGIFPDHTARVRFAPIQVDRLARSLHPAATDELAEALALHGAVGLLELLGRQWYRLAIETAPVPAGRLADLASVSEHFVDARRALNHLADRWLFPSHAQWLPTPN